MSTKEKKSRLSVIINCIDCGAERAITKACLSLVKRCKPCQKIFNRDKARNRYRDLKGIPLDRPIPKKVKEKAPKPKVEKEKEKEKEKVIVNPDVFIPSAPVELTDEERERRKVVLNKLMDLIDDDATTDDW